VVFEKLLQLEERLDAVFGWRAAPFRESCGSSLDRGGSLGGVAKRGLSDDLAGGGLATSTHSVAPDSIHCR